MRFGRRHRGPRGAVAAVRKPDAVVPADQAAGDEQAGRPQRGFADDDAGAESDAAGELVGFALDGGNDLKGGSPDGEAGARLQIEPRHQGRIDGRAESAIAWFQRTVERHAGIEGHLAVQGIGAIDCLEFDEGPAPIGGARHRPHRGAGRDLAAAFQKAAFKGIGLAVDQQERKIAAENDAALPLDSIGEAARERADAGDRHDAERDAGDENAKAVQAAAKFAEREAQGAKLGGARGGGQRHAGLGAYRLRRMWTGQNSSNGMPIIMPASQTCGETQVCAALSLGPQT